MKQFLSLILASSMILQTATITMAATPINVLPITSSETDTTDDSDEFEPTDGAIQLADDFWGIVVEEDTITLTDYNGEATEITIPKEIKAVDTEPLEGSKSETETTYIVTGLADGMFEGNETITSVTIEEGVTSIGEKTFAYCPELTTITLPETINEIGSYAFAVSPNLSSVNLPESLTELSQGLFAACYALEEFIIPNSVKVIGESVFALCVGLKSIEIGSGITELSTGLFNGCPSLEKVVIPATIKTMGKNVFSSCTNLTTAGNGEEYAIQFAWTDSIPENAFSSNTITSVTLPDGLTAITANTFSGCINLMELNLPAGLKSIASGSFEDSLYLTDLNFGGTLDQWNAIDGSIDVEKNQIIQFEDDNYEHSYYYRTIDDLNLITGYNGTETQLTIPNVIDGVDIHGIADDTFKNNNTFTSVSLPENITYIGENAFNGAKLLKEVTKYDNTSQELRAIVESRSTSEDIVVSEGAFSNCPELTTVTFPEGITVLEENMLSNCQKLTTVSLPASLTEIKANVLNDCGKLVEITFSGTEEEWEDITGIETFINSLGENVEIPFEDESETQTVFELTLNANGGKFDSEETKTVSTTAQGKLPENMPEPTKVGYFFKGWYTLTEEGDLITANTKFDKDTELFAQWVEGVPYTISFDAGDDVTDPASMESGIYGLLVGTLPTPSKNGFEFLGWYTAAEDGTLIESTTKFEQDTTIYAQWKEIIEYTITFNPGEGTVVTESLTTGAGGKIVGDIPTPELDGYTFLGWFTEETDEEESVQIYDTTSFSGNTTVYAKWELITDGENPDGEGENPDGEEENPDGEEENPDAEEEEKPEVTVPTIPTIGGGSVFQFPTVPEISYDLNTFTDVNASWSSYSKINLVVNSGVMSAHGTRFQPNLATNRREIAVALYAVAGKPVVWQHGLVDVAADDAGAAAMYWVKSVGLMTGTSSGQFMPDETMTREQFASYLYMYARTIKPIDDSVQLFVNNQFNDQRIISNWAQAAVIWCGKQGLMIPDNNGNFGPRDFLTREDLAVAMGTFLEIM